MRVPIWFMPISSLSQNWLTRVSRILTEASRKLTKSMNRLDSAFALFVMGKSRDLSCIQNKQKVKTWPKS